MRLTQGLCRAVQVRPNAIATIDGDIRRTWRETGERVARFGTALRALGVHEGDRVAVLANNCTGFYEAYFAIFWAGGVIVPFNTRLAGPELQFQLDDAGATVVLFGQEFAHVASDLKLAGTTRRIFIGLDGAEDPADHGFEQLIAKTQAGQEVCRDDDDLAGIFYTGGTSGLPKGVMLKHRNLAAMAVNLIMAVKIDEDCVNLHAAPMFHLADIGTFMTTMVAGTHVFVRQLNEEKILQLIERHRITHIFTVPAVIDRLAKHPRLAGTDLSSLHVLGYGGSPIPRGTYDLARANFPNVNFVQGFGLTEMGAHTFLGPRYHHPGADPEKMKSAGRACFGYEVKIVDKNGMELPRRQVGEIVGRGDNVMVGYWHRPDETALVLRDGWLHTQDVGFMDEDGFVYVTDRLRDMIVTGAENVYSIEVENVLSKHPAVDECAVIGVPDERWGERVHAVIVPKAGYSIDLQSADTFCRKEIAGYKCPKSIELRTQPLPRTAAGKILKRELRDPHWEGQERAV